MIKAQITSTTCSYRWGWRHSPKNKRIPGNNRTRALSTTLFFYIDFVGPATGIPFNALKESIDSPHPAKSEGNLFTFGSRSRSYMYPQEWLFLPRPTVTLLE